MAENIKGSISISLMHGRDNERPIEIRVTDEVARVRAITVSMTLEQFAQAITGHGHCECIIEHFSDGGLVGTVGENKEENVPVPTFDDQRKNKNWKAKALKPFRIDGWHEREGDIDNYTHRHFFDGKQDFQRVVFFRNVRKDGTPVIPKEAADASR
jgi:hypothetical protein